MDQFTQAKNPTFQVNLVLRTQVTTEKHQSDTAPTSGDQAMERSTDATQGDAKKRKGNAVPTSTIELKITADVTQSKRTNRNMVNNITRNGSVDAVLAPSSQPTTNEGGDGNDEAQQQIEELKAAAIAREAVIDACHDELVRIIFRNYFDFALASSSQSTINGEGDGNAQAQQQIKEPQMAAIAHKAVIDACRSVILRSIYQSTTLGASDFVRFDALVKRIVVIHEEVRREHEGTLSRKQ